MRKRKPKGVAEAKSQSVLELLEQRLLYSGDFLASGNIADDSDATTIDVNSGVLLESARPIKHGALSQHIADPPPANTEETVDDSWVAVDVDQQRNAVPAITTPLENEWKAPPDDVKASVSSAKLHLLESKDLHADRSSLNETTATKPVEGIASNAPYSHLDLSAKTIRVPGDAPGTISFWLYLESLAGNEVLANIVTGGYSESEIVVARQGEQIEVTAKHSSAAIDFYQTGKKHLTEGSWAHIAITRDIADTQIYVDGVQYLALASTESENAPQSTDSAGTTTDGSYPLRKPKDFGIESGNISTAFLDDGRLYNVVLSAGEIAGLHQNVNDGILPESTKHLADYIQSDVMSDPVTGAAADELPQLLIVDEQIEGYESLVNDITSGNDTVAYDILTIAETESGIAVVSDFLAGGGKFSAVHIVGHGSSGEIQLGTDTLTAATLSSYEQELASWTPGLSVDADILVYGCEVAGSVQGQALVRQIAAITDSDIAASDDLTGHADLGGNWALEYQVGNVEADVAFSNDQQGSWHGTLDISSSLVAHLEFEENGGSVATDSTVNGNDGSWTNAPSWSGDSAVGAFSLDFTGDSFNNNAVVAVPDDVSLDFNNDFSVAFWYNADDPQSNSTRIIGSHDGSTGFSLFADANGDFSFFLEGASGTHVRTQPGALIADGAWHHITATRTGDDLRIYVDAALTGFSGSAVGTVSPAASLTIGGRDAVVGDFDGKLDDVRVYTRALASSDVTELYNLAGSGPQTLTVINTNDNGTGSLRQAIIDANANNGQADTIEFNIPGVGSQIISLVSDLPVITDQVTIDGTTQTDWAEASYLPIVVDGDGSYKAFKFGAAADNSEVRGLVLRDLVDAAVEIADDADGVTVAGNWIGQFNSDGSDAGASEENDYGVRSYADNTTVGGSTQADRNVFAGTDFGVVLRGTSSNSNVSGNYFGTDITGNALLGSGSYGIYILETANGNTIGGSTAAHGNVIAGAASYAIRLFSDGNDNNTFQNNYIGVSADGTQNLGNSGSGIALAGSGGADNNQILDNIIVGSQYSGIELNSSANGNVIQGNIIGTDASGTLNWGNRENGVIVLTGSSNNLIGGTGVGEGNVIAFNGQGAVARDAGVSIRDPSAGNQIRGNSIYANSGLGVDLNVSIEDGADANDAGDTDTGGNNRQNWAVLSTASIADDGTFAYVLDTTTLSAGTYTIDFYASSDRDGGQVEAQRYLGTATGVASGDSSLSGTLAGVSLATGEFVTLITTDASGNSSELSGYATATDGDSDGVSPEEIKVTATGNGGLGINNDGGNDSYLIADDSDALFGGRTSLSFETQFASNSVSKDLVLLSYAVPSNGNEIVFEIRNDGSATLIVSGAIYNSTVFDYSTLQDGARHSLGFTWDGTNGNWVIYADGVAVDSTAISSGTLLANGQTIGGNGVLLFGQMQDNIGGSFDNTQVFTGSLINSRLFSDVRTEVEMAASYRSELPHNETDMLAQWNFNALSVDGIVTDSVSGNNLTVKHTNDAGFTGSEAMLALMVDEHARDGSIVGMVTAIDAQREAQVSALLMADADLRYSGETGKFYKVVTGSYDWSVAKTNAEATPLNSVNGQLSVIRTANENEFLRSLANSETSGGSVFIGGSDATEEGEWRWIENGVNADEFWQGAVDGYRSGTYSNWFSSTQPDDSGANEDAIRLDTTDGKWYDSPITGSPDNYIVEWDADAVLDASQPLSYAISSQTVANAFEVDSSTGEIRVRNGSLLNFGSQPSHTLTIHTTDVNGNTNDQNFTVNLNNLLESNSAPTDLSAGIELNADGGNNTYLSVASSGNAGDIGDVIGGLSAFTLEFNFSGADVGRQTLLSYAATDPDGNDILVRIDQLAGNGYLTLVINGSVNQINPFAIDYDDVLLDGEPHSLALTWDNTNGDWAIYVDGDFIESGTGLAVGETVAGDASTGQLVIGNEQDSYGGGFQSNDTFRGTLYDVRLWSGVRSPADVALNHQHKFQSGNLPVGLIANWQMDGFNGSNEVVDVVGGNNLAVESAGQTAITNWTNQVGGVTVSGNTLTFVDAGAPDGWGSQVNSTSVSTLGYSDDYTIRFTVDNETNNAWTIGLGSAESSVDFTDPEFALFHDYINGVDTVSVRHNGVSTGTYNIGMTNGGVFGLYVNGTTLEYQYDGVTFATDTITAATDWYIDSSFYVRTSDSTYDNQDDYSLSNFHVVSGNDGLSTGFQISTPVDDLHISENALAGASVGFVVPTDPDTPQDIVLDGSFSNTPDATSVVYAPNSFGDWTVTVENVNILTGWEPGPLGGKAVELHGDGAVAGAIEQTLTTEIGRQYQVVFASSGNWTNGDAVKDLRVSAGGVAIDYQMTQPAAWSTTNMLWSTRSFTFTANSTATALSFASLDTPSAWGPVITDVQVIEVPQAVTTILNNDPSLTYDAATAKFYKVSSPLAARDYATSQTDAANVLINGVGGQLVNIRSDYENELVLNLVGEAGLGSARIGALDATTEGTWRWVNNGVEADSFYTGGAATAYSNFASGQPDDAGGIEDSLQIINGDGTWADIDASQSLQYVMEWNASNVLSGFTYSLTDSSNNFEIDSSTGEITVVATRSLDYEIATSHDIDVFVTDVTGNSYSETMSIRVDNGIEPGQLVPAAQNVTENSTLTFSSGNGNAVTVTDTVDSTTSPLQVFISVNDGVLTLSQTTGLSILGGSNGSTFMTIQGTESDINAAFEGLTYTPDTDFTGAVTLNMTTSLQADLEGHYTFESATVSGSTVTDESVGLSQNGTLTGSPPIVSDSERGDVLSLNGSGQFMLITGLLGEPANLTLAAWINATSADVSGAVVISMGTAPALYLEPDGTLLGYYESGGTDYVSRSTESLLGTGWRHVAVTIDTASQQMTVFIDGSAIETTVAPAAIEYDNSPDTYIGRSGDGGAGFDFDGLIDEVRIYSRALSVDEIASLSADLATSSDSVAITVQAVNNAPYFSSLPGANPETIESLTGATSVTSGDLDNDGDVDLVSTTNSGQLLWHENNSSGVFSAGTLIASAQDFGAVVATDLDGDGDVDIVAANDDPADAADSIYVLLNNFVGTSAVTFNTATYEGSVGGEFDGSDDLAVGDIDGDGRQDIAATFYRSIGDSQIAVFEQNATGVFTKTYADIVSNTEGVAIADMDGDLDLDLVVGDFQNKQILLFTNNGNVTAGFNRSTIASSVGSVADLDVGDFDSDGDVDVGYITWTTNTVGLLTNDGSTTPVFTSTLVDSGVSPLVYHIDVADTDGDGSSDLIVTSNNSDEIHLYENNGSAEFTHKLLDTSTDDPVWAEAADVDGDGQLDIIFAAGDGDSIGVHINQDSGNFVRGTTNEDVTLSGLSVQIDDDDAGASLVEVAIEVSNGIAALDTTGVTVLSGGSGSSTIVFEGTVANINTVLSNFSYTPTIDFVGLGNVQITVDDRGNIGAGGAKTATESLFIDVQPQPDNPTDIATQTGNNLVANSSIEVGTSDWTLAGNVVRQTGQGASDGDYAFQFSHLDSANTGVVSTTIATTIGQTYTVTFDMAAFGSALGLGQHQAMEVLLIGSANLVTDTITDTGSDPASFDSYRYTFVADSTTTTLQFSDNSSVTTSVDLVLDNIRAYEVDSTPAFNINENSIDGTSVGTVFSVDADLDDTFTYSLPDSAAGRFAINSSTGEVTVADASSLDYETATSHNITVEVTDSNSGSYDEILTITIDNGADAIHVVPGAQSVDEDNVLTFSSGNAVTVSDGLSGSDLPLQVSLSVNDGVLFLSQTNGITFVEGVHGNDSFVINGTESAINAALHGMTFQPNAEFSGNVTLTMTTALTADLAGHYTFESATVSGSTVIDESAGPSQNGTLSGNAAIINDAERGDVLSLDGTADSVDIASDFGDPADVTLAAWVNIDELQTSYATVVEIGYVAGLRYNETSQRLEAYVHNGTEWTLFDFDSDLSGAGWNHVAFSWNESTTTGELYLNGVLVSNASASVVADAGSPTGIARIGENPAGGWALNGLIDDVRVYSRALPAEEIAALTADQVTATDSVSITINVENDAPTFGVGPGTSNQDLLGGNANEFAEEVIVLADGSSISAGNVFVNGNRGWAIAKWTSDGSLDTSFGTGGVYINEFGVSNNDYAKSIVEQADGKLVIGGYVQNTDRDFAVMRLNADGSVDNDFGLSGVVFADIGTSDSGNDIAIQSDGNILITGRSNADSNLRVVRLSGVDGDFDNGFGVNGIATIDLGGSEYATSIAVDGSGRIILVGFRDADAFVARLTSTGSLDTSFGNPNGYATTSLGGTSINDVGQVIVQSDGSYVLVGSSFDYSLPFGQNEAIGIARFTSTGIPDTGFGDNGIVRQLVNGSNIYNNARDVIQQSDGKLIVVGVATPNSFGEVVVLRYNTNGTLDTGFGENGIVFAPSGFGSQEAYGVDIASDGTILVAGYSTYGGSSDFDTTIWRFDSTGALSAGEGSGRINDSPTFIEGGTAVVLDTDVVVYDRELSANENFSGSTLTLVRNGGASGEDVFSATGLLGTLIESGSLVYDGTTIGTVTTNSAGSLLLSFNASATNNLVNNALRSIAYSNSSDAPPATVQISWTFDDGGDSVQTQGGAAEQATGSSTVNITATNDAPVINRTNQITNGDFETGDLSAWTTTGQVTALSGNHLRFGDADVAGPHTASQSFTTVVGQTYTLKFDYRDDSISKNQTLQITVDGATNNLAKSRNSSISGTSYSTYNYSFVADSTTTTLTFTDASSDSVTVDGYIDNISVFERTSLTPISEDDVNNNGNSIGSILSSVSGDRVTDANTSAVEGIAVTDTSGAFDYSIDSGTTWQRVDQVSMFNALLLRATDLIRFIPNEISAQSATIEFRAWDQTSGAAGTYVSTSTNGGASAFSTEIELAYIATTDVNDSPSFGSQGGFAVGYGQAGYNQNQASLALADGSVLFTPYDNSFNSVIGKLRPDGQLATAFGNKGYFDSSSLTFIRDIKEQADGKFLVTGDIGNDIGLARYLADGTLDTVFGAGGVVTTDVSGADDGYEVAVHTDGTIVVVGSNDTDSVVARYTSAGVLDTTFDGDGIFTVSLGGIYEHLASVMILSDGRILAAGENHVIQLTTTGALDTTFDTDGILSVGHNANSLIVQADGLIAVTGQSGNNLVVSRFDANGIIDTGFGVGGIATWTNPFALESYGVKVIEQANGKLVVAGTAETNSTFGQEMTVVRFNSDGTLDTAFGNNGVWMSGLTEDYADGYDISLYDDGGDEKIVVGGYDSRFGFSLATIARLNSNGTLDTSYQSGQLDGNPSFVEGGLAVVLDGNVQIFDRELSKDDTFTGATLLLARNGDANVEDVFSATGNLVLNAGTLELSTYAVGSYVNANGQLLLTFGSSITNEQVNEVMHSIVYANSSDSPPGAVQIDWTFSDGNAGEQGAGGPLTTVGSTVVDISAVNDNPTNSGTLPANVVVVEDTSSNVNLSALNFDDVDAGSAVVTVTLQTSTGGQLTATPGSGLTIGGTATARTFSGTVTDLNAYFNVVSNIQYVHPTTHMNGDDVDSISVTINDGGNNGVGGGVNISLGVANIDISAVNDTPNVVGPGSAYNVDEQTNLAIHGSGFSVSDVDVASGAMTVTVSVGEGVLTVDEGDSGVIVLAGNGTDSVSFAGSLTQINNLLTGVGTGTIYLFNNSDTPGLSTAISVAVNDNGNTGTDPGLTADGSSESGAANQTVAFNNVSDPPVISNLAGDTLSYLEGDGDIVIDQGAVAAVTDADSVHFDSGTLTVSFVAGTDGAEDLLAIQDQGLAAGQIGVSGSDVTYGGAIIGAVTGGSAGVDLVITLNSGADTGAISSLVNAITYENTNTDNPATSNRIVRYVLTDGDGGTTTNYDITVSVTTTNDAPVISGLSGDTLTYTEGDGAQLVDQMGDSVVADVDSADFGSGTLSISFLSGSDTAEDELSISNQGTGTGLIGVSSGDVSFGGVVIGSFNEGVGGNDLTIALNANADAVAISSLLRAVAYQNTDTDNPTTGARVIRYVLTDGDGGTSSSYQSTVNVISSNDNPSVIGLDGDHLAYTEGDGDQRLDQLGDAMVSDVDSADLDIGSLTVRFTVGSDNAEDILGIESQGSGAEQISVSGATVSYQGVVIGSVNGGSNGTDLVVAFNSSADVSAASALIQAVTYRNTDTDNPTTTSRSVTFTLSDGDGGDSATVTSTIAVTGVNDPPVLGSSGGVDAYVEGGAGTYIDSNLLVADVDSLNLDGGVLVTSIVSQASADDVLLVREGNNLSIAGANLLFDNGTGPVSIATISGGAGADPLMINFNVNATVASVQATAQQIAFRTNTDDPIESQRSIEMKLSDGDGGVSNTVMRGVNVNAVNDAPNLTAIESPAITYVENQVNVAITSGISVMDVDDTIMQSATVAISDGYVAGEDLLTFTDTATITASWDDSTGTLSLTGADTNIAYTQALRSVSYTNNSDHPNTDTRTISFAISDGSLESTAATRGITINAINDNPFNSGTVPPSQSITEDIPASIDLTDLDLIDVDAANDAMTLLISSNNGGGLHVTNSGALAVNSAQQSSVSLTGTLHDINNWLNGAGGLVYTPVNQVHGVGVDRLDISINDQGNNGIGNGADVVIGNVLIDIASVNDGPSGADGTVSTREDQPYVFEISDFGFSDNIDGNDFQGIELQSLPFSGTLYVSGAALNAATNNTVTAADIATGLLQYVPEADGHGADWDSFSFRVQDNGGTAFGGVDTDATVRTITINVDSVNDAPDGRDLLVSTDEDTDVAIRSVDFGFSDLPDGDFLSSVIVDTTPVYGVLLLNGVFVTAGQQIDVFDIDAAQLVYRPDAQVSGIDQIEFRLVDNGVSQGDNTSLSSNTLSIDVAGVNDAPAGRNNEITTDEDTPYIFAASDFGFTDVNDVNDELSGVIISALPGSGSLTLNAISVSAGDVISVASLSNGELQYLADAEQSGLAYTRFSFQVQDNNPQPGPSTDSVARDITININPVSDAPRGQDNTAYGLEDDDYTLATVDFGFSDVEDGNALVSVIIEQLPVFGTLYFSGLEVMPGAVVAANDIESGALIYRPAENFHGTDHLQFRLQDDGQFVSAITGNVSNTSADSYRLLLDIKSVNDEPSGTDNTITTSEDSVHIFSQSEFGFSDLADLADNHQFVAITITSLPDNGSVTLAGTEVLPGQVVSAADINAGLLQYRPPQNESGSGYRGIGFRVHDSGGNENNGVRIDQSPNQISFDLPGVNDSPLLLSNGATVDEGASIVIDSSMLFGTDADDPDPRDLMLTITGLPAHGYLAVNGQVMSVGDQISLQFIIDEALSYTHDESETSADSFDVALTDGGEDGAEAAHGDFQLAVTEVIDASAVVDDDHITLKFGEAFDSLQGDLLASGYSALNKDTLVNQQRFTVALERAPQHGSVVLNADGTFAYEHDGSRVYVDEFIYRVTNEDGIFTLATVSITIEPPLGAAFGNPQIVDQSEPESVMVEPKDLQEAEPEEMVSAVEQPERSALFPGQAFSKLSAAATDEPSTTILQVSQVAQTTESQSRAVVVESDYLGVIQHKYTNTAEFNLEDFGSVGQTTMDIVLEVKVPTIRELAGNPYFLDGLSKLENDLKDADTGSGLRFHLAEETVVAASFGASVGIISWALRGGAIFASLMSAGPLWWSIDMASIPASMASKKSRESVDADHASEDQNLEKIFEDDS